MTVLVIGGSGYLGRDIVRQSTAEGRRVAATFLTRRPEVERVHWVELDVRNRRHIGGAVAAVGPQVIVNAASHRGAGHHERQRKLRLRR